MAFAEALTKGESTPATFEARLRAKDGQALDVLLAATPISLAGKDGFILIARSLSGQRAMEAALEALPEAYEAGAVGGKGGPLGV